MIKLYIEFAIKNMHHTSCLRVYFINFFHPFPYIFQKKSLERLIGICSCLKIYDVPAETILA